jgi:serine/threonine protein kinase
MGVKLTYEELQRRNWETRTFGFIMASIADCTLKTFFEVRDSGNDMYEWDRSSIDRVKKWVGCLASGLAYIHSRVVHKDIKPANILITNGHVQYADFGISRTIDNEDTESQTYGVPGPRTALYCAPEVANWDRRGRKADVFSLGCVFVEKITVGLGLSLSLSHFCQWRETDGTRIYHQTLDRTLKWLILNRTRALDRTAYCFAMLNPDPDERISSSDLASWIACQRDYSSYYRGNRECQSLGNLPVGEFWTTCLHAFSKQEGSTSWATIRSLYLARYKWKQFSRENFPILLETIHPPESQDFQPATNWAMFRRLTNLVHPINTPIFTTGSYS